jgi:hypothetical protein
LIKKIALKKHNVFGYFFELFNALLSKLDPLLIIMGKQLLSYIIMQSSLREFIEQENNDEGFGKCGFDGKKEI